MSAHRQCHEVAARILSGKSSGDPNLLHFGMYDCLTEIDDLARCDGGELVSRQAIALFIFAWKNANPGVRPYGRGD